MKIIHIVNGFAFLMLVLALGGAGIAYRTTTQSQFFNERIMLAHESYEAHLTLSSNTYQLFKQYGDAMLIGDRDQGAGEAELISRIRSDIILIRGIINDEIALVGQEEIGELVHLTNIEIKLEGLIRKFEALTNAENPEEMRRNWASLSSILDDEIDRDFRSLIDDALEEELEEVEETRTLAMAQARLAKRMAIGFAVLAVAVTLLSLRSYRKQIIRPLERLMGGVRAFASGDFAARIGLVERNEVAEVGRVLDDMAAKVEAHTKSLTEQNAELEAAVQARTDELERLLKDAQISEHNRRQLLADVSHELRTPLTIIQGESDIALRGGDKSPAEYRAALTHARDAAAHTARLVNDLLFISRKEAGQARLSIEPMDLRALMQETIEMSQETAKLVTDLDKAPAHLDPMRLRQSLIALLHNARHHGGGEITMRLNSSPKGYRIMVEDNGPGLSDNEKEHAFERFFRGSNAAESYGEGAGLGLPVVRSVAEAHGGRAWLEDRPGGGLVAIIDLPERPKTKVVK